MKSKSIIFIAFVVVIVLAACSSQPTPTTDVQSNPTAASQEQATTADAATLVSYAKDIAPFMQKYCNNCHGLERISRGLDLRTYDTIMKGSLNGPMVIAGEAGNSRLAQSVLMGKMPKRGTKPTQAEIDMLVNWINQGANNN